MALETVIDSDYRFTLGYRVQTFNFDGSLLGNFVRYGFASLSFSPDGSRFAAWVYQRAYGTVYFSEIHTVNVDGTGDRSLGQGSAPTWSKARSEIVFLCSGICVIADDGSAPRQILSEQPDDFWTTPAVALDGGTAAVACGSDICLVDLGTGSLIRATLLSRVNPSYPSGFASLSLSTDAQQVFYLCQAPPPSYNVDVCAINHDGSGFRKLTDDAAVEDAISVSPGGP